MTAVSATGQTGAAPAAATTPTIANGTPAAFVADATDWVRSGVPYLWGGVTRFGADCSGFAKAALGEIGVQIAGRTSEQQAADGTAVASLAQAQAGDLIFYGYEGTDSHEAIYLGNGLQAAETSTGTLASIQPVDTSAGAITAIRRILNPNGTAAGPGVTVGNVPTPAPGPSGTIRDLAVGLQADYQAGGANPGLTSNVLTSAGGTSVPWYEWATDPAGAVAGTVAGGISSVGSSAASSLLSWADSYALRAALVIFGLAAVSVGLWRLVGGSPAGRDADGVAKDAAVLSS